MMSCVQTTLRGESQTVGTNHPTLNQRTNQPIKHDLYTLRKFAYDKGGILISEHSLLDVQLRKPIKCEMGILILQL